MTYTIDDIKAKTEEIKAKLEEALEDNVLTPEEAEEINALIHKLGEMIFEDAMFKMKTHLEDKNE